MCIWPKASAYNKCSKLFFPLSIYSFNLKNLNRSINPPALQSLFERSGRSRRNRHYKAVTEAPVCL